MTHIYILHMMLNHQRKKCFVALCCIIIAYVNMSAAQNTANALFLFINGRLLFCSLFAFFSRLLSDVVCKVMCSSSLDYTPQNVAGLNGRPT